MMFRISSKIVTAAAAASLLVAGIASVRVSVTHDEISEKHNMGRTRVPFAHVRKEPLKAVSIGSAEVAPDPSSLEEAPHVSPDSVRGQPVFSRVENRVSRDAVLDRRLVGTPRHHTDHRVSSQSPRPHASRLRIARLVVRSTASFSISPAVSDREPGKQPATRQDEPSIHAPLDKPRLPIAFSLPEDVSSPGSREEELIYQNQLSFSNDLNPPDHPPDPASETYANRWRVAVESHDDFLRRTLGWDRFNRLSALAAQKVYQEAHGSP